MSKKIFIGIIVFFMGIKILGEGYLKGYLKGSVEGFVDVLLKIMMRYRKHRVYY
ncbi:hypothetical protein NRK67_02130 [Fusobacteria bacterium ZRK30]|nr:hypothetical protein NRK67_02130 [Fusobacteria bacterium ZRK30]